MSSMSYCEFRNGVGDLRQLADSMDKEASPEEHKARIACVRWAVRMLNSLDGFDLDEKAAMKAAEDLPQEDGFDEDEG